MHGVGKFGGHEISPFPTGVWDSVPVSLAESSLAEGRLRSHAYKSTAPQNPELTRIATEGLCEPWGHLGALSNYFSFMEEI